MGFKPDHKRHNALGGYRASNDIDCLWFWWFCAAVIPQSHDLKHEAKIQTKYNRWQPFHGQLSMGISAIVQSPMLISVTGSDIHFQQLSHTPSVAVTISQKSIVYSTIRNTKLEDLHRLLGWERRQSQIVLPCLSQNQLLSGWHLSAMPVGKWHVSWASLRHMQSMQVHCPTHNEQCVISHYSKNTGTETGWSCHVSHTYTVSTPCTQQEVAAYNDGWKCSQMTCHEYIYKSLLCCSCFCCSPSPMILPLSKLH